ncbi:hypothetical protein ACIBU0_43780 [Streptomyces sp. NPDC049627]|uniref:hypothetical protein n=1 Tax=Streptomyces sp. NPDC049627 TaxID=3365595 RepID=UPI0037953A0E
MSAGIAFEHPYAKGGAILSCRHALSHLRSILAATAAALLIGAGTATAADFTPSPSPTGAPSARPAAGPENAAAAGSRPVSGRSPSAGPPFVKGGSTWNVIGPKVVLRNTVTDADGDTANLTFEVWTTDSAGKPKTQVKLTDDNPYGVLVSGFVASGKTAQVTVPDKKLKPGVTYTFHTSAYDGSLYETEWSPWANFKINPYVSFPAPQASSTIDSLAQKNIEFTRTDPGPVAGVTVKGTRPKGLVPSQSGGRQSCSQPDDKGRRLCIELSPPTKESKQRVAAANAVAADGNDPNLVSWCGGSTAGKDFMNRTEACMKSIGSATLTFVDSDPDSPKFGIAVFDIQQQIKTYTKKATAAATSRSSISSSSPCPPRSTRLLKASPSTGTSATHAGTASSRRRSGPTSTTSRPPVTGVSPKAAR